MRQILDTLLKVDSRHGYFPVMRKNKKFKNEIKILVIIKNVAVPLVG